MDCDQAFQCNFPSIWARLMSGQAPAKKSACERRMTGLYFKIYGRRSLDPHLMDCQNVR